MRSKHAFIHTFIRRGFWYSVGRTEWKRWSAEFLHLSAVLMHFDQREVLFYIPGLHLGCYRCPENVCLVPQRKLHGNRPCTDVSARTGKVSPRCPWVKQAASAPFVQGTYMHYPHPTEGAGALGPRQHRRTRCPCTDSHTVSSQRSLFVRDIAYTLMSFSSYVSPRQIGWALHTKHALMS